MNVKRRWENMHLRASDFDVYSCEINEEGAPEIIFRGSFGAPSRTPLFGMTAKYTFGGGIRINISAAEQEYIQEEVQTIIEVHYGIIALQNMLINIQRLQVLYQPTMEILQNTEMQYMKLLVLAMAILVVGTLVTLTFLILATQCSCVVVVLSVVAARVCLRSSTTQVKLTLTAVSVQYFI